MEELYRAKLVADPTARSQPQPNLNPGFMVPPSQQEPEPIGLNNLYYHPPAERAAPINEPTVKSRKVSRSVKLHPLVWFSVILSLLALVLNVPKGSLPTLTGRHKALRAKEKALEQQQLLLIHLASFLPEPLATLVAGPGSSHIPSSILHSIKPAGDVWHVEAFDQGFSQGKMIKISGQGNEAWVIQTTGGDAATTLLLPQKGHRAELASSRQPSLDVTAETYEYERKRKDLDEQSKRERQIVHQRQIEVEEREVEVSRREQWVVEEMRKLVEKTHSQANELSLEDKITERLKAYQRQLRQAQEEHAEV